jgi:hypothetical protein
MPEIRTLMPTKSQHSGIGFVGAKNINEAILKCPRCNAEIKISESLAAPLIKAMRQEYQHKVSQQIATIANHEAVIRQQQTKITEVQESVEERVSATLEIEREHDEMVLTHGSI